MRVVIRSFFLLCFSLSCQVFAADIPTVVEGHEEFNKEMCVQNKANTCVNNICMNSTDIECIPKCQVSAENECKEQAEE